MPEPERDWIEEACSQVMQPGQQKSLYVLLSEAHSRHCHPLTPALAERIAEEIRRCYHVQAFAGGDPVKETLPLTILRVRDGAGGGEAKGKA